MKLAEQRLTCDPTCILAHYSAIMQNKSGRKLQGKEEEEDFKYLTDALIQRIALLTQRKMGGATIC